MYCLILKDDDVRHYFSRETNLLKYIYFNILGNDPDDKPTKDDLEELDIETDKYSYHAIITEEIRERQRKIDEGTYKKIDRKKRCKKCPKCNTEV